MSINPIKERAMHAEAARLHHEIKKLRERIKVLEKDNREMKDRLKVQRHRGPSWWTSELMSMKGGEV